MASASARSPVQRLKNAQRSSLGRSSRLCSTRQGHRHQQSPRLRLLPLQPSRIRGCSPLMRPRSARCTAPSASSLAPCWRPSPRDSASASPSLMRRRRSPIGSCRSVTTTGSKRFWCRTGRCAQQSSTGRCAQQSSTGRCAQQSSTGRCALRNRTRPADLTSCEQPAAAASQHLRLRRDLHFRSASHPQGGQHPGRCISRQRPASPAAHP